MSDTTVTISLERFRQANSERGAKPQHLQATVARLRCNAFDVGIGLCLRLPKKLVAEESQARRDLEFYAQDAVPAYFAAFGNYDLFEIHDVDVADYFESGLPAVPEGKLSAPRDLKCTMDPDGFESIFEQAPEFRAAAEAFRSIVDKLDELTGLNPPFLAGYSSEIRSLLFSLERLVVAGYWKEEAGWYSEKLTGIRQYADELIRRKNPNHPGYQRARDYIRANLSCFSPPSSWRSRPPQPRLSGE